MEIIPQQNQYNIEENFSIWVARFGKFELTGDFSGPSVWVETINFSGQPIDAKWIKIGNDDWQNWPCNLSDKQDYEYLSSVISKKLNLTNEKKILFTEVPLSQIRTGCFNYNSLNENNSNYSNIFNVGLQNGFFINEPTNDSSFLFHANLIGLQVRIPNSENNVEENFWISGYMY